MRAVDTNVIVRLLVRDDPKQAEAADLFVSNGAWVSTVALAETVWVLRANYGQSATQLATAIEMLLMHKDLVLQDSEAVAGALSLFRSRPSLRFSDCLILELARKNGYLPLGTFDRRLARTDGAQKL